MMIWLYSLIFLIVSIVYIIVCASVILLIIPFTNSSGRYLVARFWCRTTMWLLSKICGIDCAIEGMENLPKDLNVPLIVMGKHQSAWETIAYPAIFPRELCFVFKRELFYLPFFGWALASMGMIHIDRGDREKARVAVEVQGRKILKEGKWIVIYPEGTRTPRGSFKPYRKGGARLTINTKANILPVAQNSASLWPRHSILKRPGLITISIGPIITVDGKTEDELQHELETWIETEMHRLDPSAYQS